MAQLQPALQEPKQTPPAAVSIAAAKACFTNGYKRKKIKAVFNSLSVRGRGMICIAGGLPAADCHRAFDDFNDIELQKLRRGLQELKFITQQFESKLGNVNNLKPSHFTD